MVRIFFLLTSLYYSTIFTLFLAFLTFKTLFKVTSYSPKIIYQTMIKHYPIPYIVYFLILQFIGLVHSALFYIKYALILKLSMFQLSYSLIFLIINLLTSIFFYMQFFKKWNVMTAQELKNLSLYTKKINNNLSLNDCEYDIKNKKYMYRFVYFIVCFFTFNILAPFYFADIYFFFYLFSL